MTHAAPLPASELRSAAKTSLLVSVRDASEASAALAGGADWIDLKEPHQGALGAVEASLATEVVCQVAGKAPVTAAAGELIDWPNADSRQLLHVEGISMLKLGLADCAQIHDWQAGWQAAAAEIAAAGKSLVAVAYADKFAPLTCMTLKKPAQPPAAELIGLAAQQGSVEYLLVDTCDKCGGSLLAHWDPEACRSVFQFAKAKGLKTVAAGSLSAGDLPRLPLEAIDVVAVRGAVCLEARTGKVAEHLVRRLREILDSMAC